VENFRFKNILTSYRYRDLRVWIFQYASPCICRPLRRITEKVSALYVIDFTKAGCIYLVHLSSMVLVVFVVNDFGR